MAEAPWIGPGTDTTNGTDGTDSTNGTDDTNSLIELGIPWIDDYAGILKSFGKSPQAFVLGTIFDILFGGLRTVLSAVIDSIYWVFGIGTSKTGLADVPGYAADIIGWALQPIANALLGIPQFIFNSMTSALSITGPFAPILGTLLTVAVMAAGALALYRIALVAIDAVPGGGGLVK